MFRDQLASSNAQASHTNLGADNCPGLINFRSFPYELDQARTEIRPKICV